MEVPDHLVVDGVNRAGRRRLAQGGAAARPVLEITFRGDTSSTPFGRKAVSGPRFAAISGDAGIRHGRRLRSGDVGASWIVGTQAATGAGVLGVPALVLILLASDALFMVTAALK